ncbi:MAG: FkbM family methyltransferase [Burkholderiales bacterium]|nr:FkbM family methyltransferase [Burkholderiales bacterium]
MKKLLRSSVNAIPSGMRNWIKYIPGLAETQRWLVRNILSDEAFIHTINSGPAAGLRFEVSLPLDKAIWMGTYESEFTEAICKSVGRGDVCYDIGGYRGYMSGAMALAGASSVIVFEPLPANQEALKRLCRLNPGLSIELKPIAIGNLDNTFRLRVMPDASMGKLISSTFQVGATATGEIEVPVRRLDSLVQRQEIPPPQVVKIDVEGAELDVLCGANGILSDHRPHIFLEAHSAALDQACSQLLISHGYEIRSLESYPCGEEQARHLIASPP